MGNIADIAVQNAAKNLQRMGADAFISLQACDLAGTDVILLDQRILRNPLLLHRHPKIIIGYHMFTHFLLDIITERGV